MYMLIQFKSKASFQGFVSTSYVGELVQGSNPGWIVLKNACAVFEMITNTSGKINFESKFMTNSVLTNGELKFRADDSDILFTKEIADTDEILKGYEGAIDAFRLQKIKIQKVDSIADANIQLDGV